MVAAPKIADGVEYLSVGVAARELSVSLATVRRWCDDDTPRLECLVDTVNGFRYVSRRSIDDLKGRFRARGLEVSGEAEAAPLDDAARRARLDDLSARAAAGRSPRELLQALRGEPDWQLRARTAERLGEMGSADAVASLIGALMGDKRREVRMRAARALGRIGSPEAVSGLAGAAKDADEDEAVRREAADALVEIARRAAL